MDSDPMPQDTETVERRKRGFRLKRLPAFAAPVLAMVVLAVAGAGCGATRDSPDGLKLTLHLDRTSLQPTDTLSGKLAVHNPTLNRYNLWFSSSAHITVEGFNKQGTVVFRYVPDASQAFTYLNIGPFGSKTYAFGFVPERYKTYFVIPEGQCRLVGRLHGYDEPTAELQIVFRE